MTDTPLAQHLPRARLERAAAAAWLRRYGVYLALAALVLYNLVATAHFAEASTLRTELLQVTPVLIVSLGIALTIGSEGIDISVGSIMALAASVLPIYLGYGPWVAIAMALLSGAVAGLVNGILIAYFSIQPIVATLGMLVAGRGVALVIAGGRLQEIFDPTITNIGSAEELGIPLSVIIAAAAVGLVWVLVRRTVFGRQLLAIGGNRKASELGGLPVRRVLLLVYLASGVLAALAGIILTSRLGASDPSFVGLGYELSAIAAVVVGGTPLTGGRINVAGTVAGAMLMQLVGSTLIKHNLYDSETRMITAVIIIAAVYIQSDRRKR